MSNKILNAVWEGAPYKGPTFCVLLALADWASDDADNLFPKVSQLMHKARLGETATRECLKQLIADGVLKQIEWATGRPGVANRYALNLKIVLGWKSPQTGSRREGVAKGEGFAEEGGTGSPKTQTGSPEVPCIDKPLSNNHHITTLIAETDVSEVGDGKRVKKKNTSPKTLIGDYTPDDSARGRALAYWRERGRPDLVAKLDDEVQGFLAYHRAHGSRMADWDAAWQTRYVNAVTYTKPPQTNASVRPTSSKPSFLTYRTGPDGFEVMGDADWILVLKQFYAPDGGVWLRERRGPAPGEPGCRVRQDLIDRVKPKVAA